MARFGLTGNKGCGKSTVAAMLGDFPDVLTIDGDLLVRDVLSLAVHRARMQTMFGKKVFVDGLAQYRLIENAITGSIEKKRAFDDFASPLLRRAIEERTQDLDTVCIVELSPLFESRWEAWFDGVIVATCSKKEQLRRIRETGSMSEVDICSRLKFQMPSAKKESKANFVIRTDGDLSELRARVQTLHHQLMSWTGAPCHRQKISHRGVFVG